MGGTGISPIINYPEVAILGMTQARLQPVVAGDEKNYKIVPRLMLPLSITFDHRVLDGAEAARFLNMVIGLLEDPEKLLMMVNGCQVSDGRFRIGSPIPDTRCPPSVEELVIEW